MWSDVCYLGKVNSITDSDDIGDSPVGILYGSEVYCDEKSIKSSDFYQAQALGIKPEVTLELMLVDYNKEKYVRYDDIEYKVLRTYKSSPEKIEIILTRGVNNAGS